MPAGPDGCRAPDRSRRRTCRQAETKLARAERLFAAELRRLPQPCRCSRGTASRRQDPPRQPVGLRLARVGRRHARSRADRRPDYFGNTRHKKATWPDSSQPIWPSPTTTRRPRSQSIIAALSAEAALPAQADEDKKAEEDGTLEKGRAAMSESFENSSCTDCHKFRDTGDLGSAPDLTGWGSKDWLVRFISDPAHEDFYRDTNDRMPSFGKGGPGPKQPLLSAEDIDLLARWLRGEKAELTAANHRAGGYDSRSASGSPSRNR